MVKRLFSKSPSYLQYIRGVRELHALIAAGLDDSPDADAIRDGMDHPWYDLSETEQRRIKGLSEDLYSLSEPPHDPLPSNPQVQRKLAEANRANWDDALELLRRWGGYLDSAKLSYRRGSIWHEAGDDATANLFFAHAARLDPMHFQDRHLLNLWNSDPSAGRVLAKEILAHESLQSVEAVVTASCIQLMATRGRHVSECRAEVEEMITALERGVSRARNDDLAFLSLKAATTKNCLYLLGSCYQLIGNSRMAIKFLDEAVAISPQDISSLLTRGVFRYGIEPEAIEDFARVIDLGSKDVWAHFYLAHHALSAGRFEECLKYCERGLEFHDREGVRAMLYEWLAISRAELDYLADQVRSAFEEAMRLAPDSDRIRENLALFEASLDNPTGPRPQWVTLRASTVQGFGYSDVRPPWPPLSFAA